MFPNLRSQTTFVFCFFKHVLFPRQMLQAARITTSWRRAVFEIRVAISLILRRSEQSTYNIQSVTDCGVLGEKRTEERKHIGSASKSRSYRQEFELCWADLTFELLGARANDEALLREHFKVWPFKLVKTTIKKYFPLVLLVSRTFSKLILVFCSCFDRGLHF